MALGQARTSSDADLAVQYASSGWVEDAESRTWSYSSADAPSYIFSVNDDMTGIVSTNMKLRFKQSAGTYKYAGVTAVGSYSGGVTLITAYLGTDYDLDNEAVTNVAYSAMKAPFGFPMSRDKWTIGVSETTDFTQASPVVGTWYNADTIAIPIGMWNVEYKASVGIGTSGTQYTQKVYSTLSTGAATESNTQLTSYYRLQTFNQLFSYSITMQASDFVSLAAKATYYLNVKAGTTMDEIATEGTIIPTIIRAVWAGL